MTRARIARTLVWLADEALDLLPAYWEGRWHLCGQWGCRLRLHRYWWPDDQPHDDQSD